MSNFTKRLLTSIVFVSVLLGAIVYGPLSFVLLFGIINFLGLREYYQLSGKETQGIRNLYATLLGTFIYGLFSLVLMNEAKMEWLLLIVPAFFSFFMIELFSKSKQPYLNIGNLLLGIFYVSVPFSLLSAIAFSGGEYSEKIILGIFFILWASDTGAYLIGSKFGKHRLFERISPKKSWEGTIGGFFSALLLAWILSIYYSELETSSWMVLAFIIVVAGNLGDLSESQLKRSLNVKDSGSLLPGHGGILDRFDALLIAVPFVYSYLFFVERYF